MSRPFEIPLNNHRRIFGVFLASHAIPDAIDLMFTGVGCKPKAQRQIAMHDRVREAGNKMVWADVGDVQLITGPAERLRNMAVETCRRRGNVGIILVTTSAAMEMTGADVAAVIPAIRRDAGCPVVSIPTPGWDGDLYAGHAETVKAVLALAPWRASKGNPRTICVSGYLLDRHENDHAANLRELRRLVNAVGGTPGAIFFAGSPMQGLMAAPAAGSHLVLPYARGCASWIARETLRPAAEVDLPVGLAASSRFVVETARLIGAPVRVARSFADTERKLALADLDGARRRLAGLRAAVLADTPLAAGLCGLLRELDASPVVVGLLDRTLGGREALESALARDGHEVAGCLVIEDPSAQEFADACGRRARGRRVRPFDLLLAPDFWLPPSVTEGVARVEIGFPSNRWHPAEPSPYYGFSGARALAGRIMDVLPRS